jgi:hypothetical protein
MLLPAPGMMNCRHLLVVMLTMDHTVLVIDDVVAEAKPLIIVSCWSEAATQEADLGVSQGETASTR